MTERALVVEGLPEFVKGLREFDKKAPAALHKANRQAMAPMVTDARASAMAAGGVRAQAAAAIKGYASAASVGVGIPRGDPLASVAFWGTDRKTGWYAAEKFFGSTGLQHNRWVGNQWRSGVLGEGPYDIADAVTKNVDTFMKHWDQNIHDAARAAFPNN